MTAVLDRLDRADRRRLLERLAELRELDRLIREPGRQRPPEPLPALTAISSTTEGTSP